MAQYKGCRYYTCTDLAVPKTWTWAWWSYTLPPSTSQITSNLCNVFSNIICIEPRLSMIAMFLWICVVWSFAESRSVRSCRDHSEDCFDKVLKSPERRDRCNSPEFSRNCCASCLSLFRRLGARYRSSAALWTGMGQTLHCLVLITRWIYYIYRK